MKKMLKIFILVFIVLILFLLIIVIINNYRDTSVPNWNNVHLYIKKNTLTSDGATIICKNKNKIKYDYYFCDKFFVDRKVDGVWVELPVLKTYIVLSVYNTYADENGAPYVYENKINWASKYGSLPQGENYRLRFEPKYYNSKEHIEDSGLLTVEFAL